MNAVNALFREKQEAELDTAVAAANKWVDLARPLILATFKLDDLASEIVRGASFDSRDHHYRTLCEGRTEVQRAFKSINEIVEGIRDDFIADQIKSCLREHSEAEIKANDNFNDALGEEVITVAEAVKIVEREWNEAFDKGRAL